RIARREPDRLTAWHRADRGEERLELRAGRAVEFHAPGSRAAQGRFHHATLDGRPGAAEVDADTKHTPGGLTGKPDDRIDRLRGRERWGRDNEEECELQGAKHDQGYA